MRQGRWFNSTDPTFLAIILTLVALARITAPWEPNWRWVPTEEPWKYLLLPQAAMVLFLRRRTPLAWVAAAVAAIMWWPNLYGQFNLNDSVLARTAFWFIAIAVCALAVRAYRGKDFGGSAAIAATAIVASLATSEAILWLTSFRPPRSRLLTAASQLTVFLGPALVLPGLLWRQNWHRSVLWTGASLASLTLAALLVFDERRLIPKTATAVAIVLSIGPVWAYLDWRRSRIAERSRGFEVMVAPTPVVPL